MSSVNALEVAERSLAVDTTARSVFLDEICGTDEALRDQVDALLAADARAGDFMAEPAATLWRNHGEPKLGRGLGPGERLGTYRILRHLGSGGYGDVFLAERADELFDKRVAIKVLSRRRIDGASRRRMVAERQILAGLEHPNIARLYDGGTTVGNCPFLVMEYVDGLPIDTYCERHGLSLEQRLELFLELCSAVRFAHQNFIVHRDLKPSNILVSEQGELKLLDFGIAKAVVPDGEEAGSPVTQGQPMTLAFASPEQLRGEPVTVATDVHGLGVILYGLLTGTHPFAEGHPPAHRVAAGICRQAPRLPSRVALHNHPGAPSAKALRGDLDCIVLKALEKSPEHRYTTVDGLVADIERYRHRLPIQARPRSWGYRFQKAISRHRALTALSVALGLCLAVFVSVLMVEIQRADAEAERAEREAEATYEVADFLVGVLGAFDPHLRSGGSWKPREILDESRRRAFVDPAMEPASQSRTLESISRAYLQLGLFKEASDALDQSLGIRIEAFGEQSKEVVDALCYRAELLRAQGDARGAKSAADRALNIARSLDDPEGEAAALHGLAVAAFLEHDLARSERLSREALAIRRQVLGRSHLDVSRTLKNLGLTLVDVGKTQEALGVLQESIAIRELRLGADDLELIQDRGSVASLLVGLGHSGEAERLLRRNIAAWRNTLGEDHPSLAGEMVNLGILVFSQRRWNESDQWLTEGRRMMARFYPPDHPQVAVADRWIADVRLAQGRFDEARDLVERVDPHVRSAFDADHPLRAEWVEVTARALVQSGDGISARKRLHEAFGMFQRILGPSHPELKAFCGRHPGTCRATTISAMPAGGIGHWRENSNVPMCTTL